MQCTTNDDCLARGPAFANSVCIDSLCGPKPEWKCLAAAPSPTPSGGSFKVALHVQDIVRKQPMGEVSARLCRKLDVDCDAPDSESVSSDADGNLQFDVQAGFTGYVQLTRGDILPGLYFFNPEVDRDQDVAPIPLVSPTIAKVLTSQLGSSLSLERGLVLLRALTCDGQPSGGVSYHVNESDDLTGTFYSVGGLPASGATETDADGYGGFVNLPPGTVTVTGHIEADQRPIGTVSLLIRPGSITYSQVVPNGK